MNIQRIATAWRHAEQRPACLALWLAVCLGGGLGAGCSTVGKPVSPLLGSVEIRGVPIERIRDVTTEVFHDHGYRVLASGWTTLTFEREGSLMNDIAYGNWMGSRIRVRTLAPRARSVHRRSPPAIS